jgi:hypothetical protein
MQVAYQIPARTQVRSWAAVALGGPALVLHQMLDTTADLPPPSRAYQMQVQIEVGGGKNTWAGNRMKREEGHLVVRPTLVDAVLRTGRLVGSLHSPARRPPGKQKH